MRGINLVVELTQAARLRGERFTVRLSDGLPGRDFCLADAKDPYSKGQWTSLLGTPVVCGSWATRSSEGMYVTVERQYPNPSFDFSPAAYERGDWLRAQLDVVGFRLYNPWIGKPFLSWAGGQRWNNDQSFYEGQRIDCDYSLDDYAANIHETGGYAIRRRDDSDNYKEFVLTLGV